MEPPKRPVEGQVIPKDWFAHFYDYVRSLEAHGDQKTVIVNRDSTGTHISTIGRKPAVGHTSSASDSSIVVATVISGNAVTGYQCTIVDPNGDTHTAKVYPAFLSFSATLPEGYSFLATLTPTTSTAGGSAE